MSNKPLKSPYDFFKTCFDLARSASLPQHESMTLITASAQAKPSGRMVLLKGVVPEQGFHFYTNFESRKAIELRANPQAQLLFYWPAQGRQIRIEGVVTQLSDAQSDAYWVTRPRASQIGALASEQSRPLNDPSELDLRVAELSEQFAEKKIPRPKTWGGFELRADYFEFWEDRANRLHERITYSRSPGGSWKIGRLWP